MILKCFCHFMVLKFLVCYLIDFYWDPGIWEGLNSRGGGGSVHTEGFCGAKPTKKTEVKP